MFCSAELIANNEQRAKLTKLLSLWESKAKFFDACVISKLQSPDSSMQEYKTNLQNLHHEVVAKFTQATKATLDNYQKQHQIFIQHATQQITQLEQQKQQLEQQMLAAVLPNASVMPPQPQQKPQKPLTNKIPALMAQKISMPDSDDDVDHMKPPGVDDNYSSGGNFHQQQKLNQQQQQLATPNFFIPDLSKPPPGFLSGGASGANVASLGVQLPTALQQQFAHMANIPPTSAAAVTAALAAVTAADGLNSVAANASAACTVDMLAVTAAIQLVQQQQQLLQQQQLKQLESSTHQQEQQHLLDDEVPPPAPHMTVEVEQIPSAPYYDLPAGLMVPLIRLEDYNYKPLDPADMRLPPPAPQSERLTAALAAFYAPPTHDRPRDNEGWEKLGLYEYYKVKNAARKQKEDEIQSGEREKSRSPSPIVMEKPKPKKTNKRCYRSKSRSRSRTRSPYRSRSRTPPSSRSRDNRSGGGGGGGGSGGRNSGGSRFKRDRERGAERDRDSSSSSRENRAERSNNNTRRERERSLSPPNFFTSNFAKPNEFIEESNKGHQMLMKMGWAGSGTGLGTKSQGIDQPISGGEVRDRKDQYKGVGINLNDPFENFRKNKGAAFVHRMRARDEKS